MEFILKLLAIIVLLPSAIVICLYSFYIGAILGIILWDCLKKKFKTKDK